MDRGPLERRELAAEHRRGGGDRLAVVGARLRDRVCRGGVLRAQVGKDGVQRCVDGDPPGGQERVERADDPGIDGERPASVAGAGEGGECGCDVGVPERIQLQARAFDALAKAEARGRRVLAAGDRVEAALRGAVEACAMELGERCRGLGGERHEHDAVAGDGSLAKGLGQPAGTGVERPPAAAGVLRRPDAANPAAVDTSQPLLDLGARGQIGEAGEHVGDVDAGPVVGGRPPFLRVPVEAAARDPAHRCDDVRVVREGQDELPHGDRGDDAVHQESRFACHPPPRAARTDRPRLAGERDGEVMRAPRPR